MKPLKMAFAQLRQTKVQSMLRSLPLKQGNARLAAAAVELVQEEGEALDRSIPCRLVYSCYPAAGAYISWEGKIVLESPTPPTPTPEQPNQSKHRSNRRKNRNLSDWASDEIQEEL